MPSQTRSSLVSLVNLLVDDVSQQRFTAAQVQAKIQEAQERFVLDTRALRDILSDSTVASQQEYSLPTDILDPIRLSVDGVEMTRISKADLDFLFGDARWDQTIGTPSHYYVDLDPNNKKFGLYPIPASAGSSNIAMEYVKLPPALSGDSDVPLDSHTLLAPYHNALAYWAAAELLVINPSQESLAKMGAFKKRYDDETSHCIELFKHMEMPQQWRFRGGRYYKGL